MISRRPVCVPRGEYVATLDPRRFRGAVRTPGGLVKCDCRPYHDTVTDARLCGQRMAAAIERKN